MDWMTLDEVIARLTMLRNSVSAINLVRVDCPLSDPLYINGIELGEDGRVYIDAGEVDRT